jgi:hypothetical protein
MNRGEREAERIAEVKRLGVDRYHPRPLHGEDLDWCDVCGRYFRPGDFVTRTVNYLEQAYRVRHRRCPDRALYPEERAAERERYENRNPQRWHW